MPYHLTVDANLINHEIVLTFQSVKTLFGSEFETVGAPFNMNTIARFKGVKGKSWAYAVKAGDVLKDTINLDDFDDEIYDLTVNGPNGFYRNFAGSKKNPSIIVKVYPEHTGLINKKLTGKLVFAVENTGTSLVTLQILDNKYKSGSQTVNIRPKSNANISFNLAKNANWYDFSMVQKGNPTFKHRYAGKIETGEITQTDPYMGNV
ncbi:phospholipase domain-containing protein [Pedobacter suwonensis]|uniref:phospholipase domain-containing protein n=1 Tax=Pedobacter suwonensis TaxID=332999 RepID=UPI001FD56969|nr:phospholipase domain-containing protein [Pedobacter suwonensis]